MTLVNSNQQALNTTFLPKITTYGGPPLTDLSTPLFKKYDDKFETQFHTEINNLEQRRTELCHKISLAKKQSPTAEQKKAIMDEYQALERSTNLLKLLADATEKSRQSIAANLR
jgi:hypothetical protein